MQQVQDPAAGAGQDDKLSTAYQDALAPLKAIRPDTFEQALGYVRTGTAPEVLTSLDAAPTDDVDRLMVEPGAVRFSYRTVYSTTVDRVRTARPGWTVDNGVRARMRVHTTAPAAAVARLGRLLATIGDVHRVAAGAPEWLTVLVNDAVSTREQNSRAVRRELFARWTPEFLTEVAREGGVAEVGAAPAVLTALLHRDAVGSASNLERLTELVTSEAMDTFLLEHADVLPEVVEPLAAPGKLAFLEVVKRNLAPHAELVASLAVDPAKDVRADATTLLATLGDDAQPRLLAPHLSTASPTRLGEVLGHLARVPGGLDTIRTALAAAGDARGQTARVKALQKTLDRAEALVGESATETEIEVPPFEPPKEFVLGDDFVTGALELLGRQREKAAERLREVVADGQESWVIDKLKNRLAKELALTEEDLRAVVRLMNGDTYRTGVRADGEEGRPSEAAAQWCLWYRSSLPATAPAHRLRLWFARERLDVAPLVGEFLPVLRDLRAVEELFVQFGVDDPGAAVDQFVFRDIWYGERGQVDLMWPYYAEHIDLLVPHLTPRESDDASKAFSRALKIVAAFPVAPAAALPQLSSLALGEDKKYRQTAQDVLSTNPGVRGLAEQGLVDGKAGIRISAAAWLTRIGDAAAVPALRAALKKERQEAGRAALLSALKALGDDISADLAPEVLLAEATKGLKKPVPANLDWFPFGRLPQLRWTDGAAGPESLVPPEVLRWWVVLACKLKEPSGDGLFALYLSRLDAASRAELGSFVLRAWVAQDTIHPPVEWSKKLAEDGAQDRYDEYQRMVQQYPGYYEALAAMSVEDHYRHLYRQHQAEYLGSAVKEKGLLALTVGMPGSDLAEAAQHYFKANKTRRAQAEALVRALAANGERAAVQLLLAVSRRFRMYTVQEVATALAKDLADRRGWDADQLADRTVQTAGFDDDGILRLDLGSPDGGDAGGRVFTGRITEKFTLELRDPEGTVVKALPPKRMSDDDDAYAEAKKQLTASRKELKAVIALQTQRFAEAMCSERTWGVDEWREFVLGHPLMSRLAARLVWVATLPDGGSAGPQVVAFRPGDGGALIGVDDGDVALPEDVRVSVAHAVTLPAARSAALSSAQPAALAADAREVEAWRGHLTDYEVTPLFDQGLGAGAVVLPELDPGAREIADHRGWLSDSFSIRGRATKLGYQRAASEDGGWFDAYTKEYPGLGVTAYIWFTGAYLPEENIPAAVTELTFQGAESWNGGRKIEDLPAALVAVSYQEYATVARAGSFDPDWAKKTRF